MARWLTFGGATGPPALVLAQAPWWVIASLLSAMLLVGLIQAVFPQNSRDRLDYWRDWWRHRENQARPPPVNE